MGGACSTYGGEEGCIQGFGGETRGKETTWKTQVYMRRRYIWEDNIKMDLQVVGYGFMDWIEVAQDRDK